MPTAAGAPGPTVTVTSTLPGLNNATSGGFEPPDAQLAAGRGFLVQMANLAERVWRTAGDTPQVVQTRRLESFFGSGADRLTDPRIVFDTRSGRWLASISDVDRHAVLLAVSSGSDPTRPWTLSSFPAGGCADQPRLGVSDDLVVLGADVYQNCDEGGASPLGSELWIVNKAQLVAGATSPAFTTFGPSGQYSSLAPAQSLSSTATEYVVSVDEHLSRVVHLLTVDGVPPDPVRVHEAAGPTIDDLARPPEAAQPAVGGLALPLATNDNRILDSVWENGRLWLSANDRCTPAGDALIRSCARVVELATATGTVDWETDVGVAGAHVFFPALRPDGAGNLVIVAGESGQKVRPELVVVGRTQDGALTPPAVVARSAGTYRGDRYGDYFAAARDPVDPSVVWVAGEAGSDIASGRGWTTALASVVVTAAGATPPRVAGQPPPGVRAVGTVERVRNGVRLVYRTLDDGVAVRAVVLVRNAKRAAVFSETTTGSTVRALGRYTVLWPAGKARGTFTYCVSFLSRSGLQSPQSCVPITLRR